MVRLLGDLACGPETGFEEIGPDRHSAPQRFSQADFGGVRGSHRNKGVSQAGI